MENDLTPVIFRKEPDGHIFAIFPTIPETSAAGDYSDFLCYARIGQHGSCSYEYYRTTRPAKPEEFANLKTELERIGYRLKVYQKMTHGLQCLHFQEQLRLLGLRETR